MPADAHQDKYVNQATEIIIIGLAGAFMCKRPVADSATPSA